MKTTKLLFVSVAAATAFLICIPVFAADYTYDGGDYWDKSDWTRATNWVNDQKPVSGGNINMAGWSANYATGTVGNITLNGGGISVNGGAPGTFVIQGNVTGPGSIGSYFDIATNTIFNNMGGTLTLGTIYGNGNTPTFTGSGTTLFYLDAGPQGVNIQGGVVQGYGAYAGNTMINGGTFVLTASNTLSTINVNSGGQLAPSASVGIGGLTGGGEVKVLSGKVLNIGYNNTETVFSGTITGPGSVGKYGPNTLTLSGNNTYTGNTTVAEGTLKLSGANAAGNTARIDINKGVLEINASNAVNTAANVSLGSSGTARLIINANQTFENISNSSPDLNTVEINSTLTVKSGTLTCPVTGGGNLTKDGTGTLSLWGTSSYSGTTTVTQGTIQYSSLVSFPQGQVTNNGNVYLVPTQNNGFFYSDVSGSGGVTAKLNYDSYVLTMLGNNEWSGLTDVQRGTLILAKGIQTGGPINVYRDAYRYGTLDLSGANSSVGTITGTGYVLIGTARLAINAATDSTMTANISGTTGGVTKMGSGKLTVSGGLTYTGQTRVEQGTWSGNAPSGSVIYVKNGAVFEGASAGGLVGNGTVKYNSSLSIGSSNQSSEFNGVIDIGNNQINKTGSGTTTFGDGANIIASGLTVGGGTLSLAGNATVTTSTGGLPTLSVNSGIFDVASGTHTVGNITGMSGKINVRSGATLGIQNSSAANINGTFTGDGTIEKSGAGQMNLGYSSPFAGTFKVSGGTLNTTIYNALPYANLDVGSGSTFTFMYDQKVGSLSGSGTVSGSYGAAIIVGSNNGSTTWSGNITGTGPLTKTGTGTMTVVGSQSYSGSTTAAGGTLTVSGAGYVKSTYNQVKTGGTLNYVNTTGTKLQPIPTGGLFDTYGGTLNFVQKGGTENNMTCDIIRLFAPTSGAGQELKINVTSTDGGQADIVAYGITNRDALTTLSYSDNGTNQLTFSYSSTPAAMTMTNGILKWAQVKNADGTYEFASVSDKKLKTYSSAGQVYTTSLASAGASSNVRLANTTETLGAGTTKTVNSVTMNDGAGIQGDGTLSTSALVNNGNASVANAEWNIGSEGDIFANGNLTVDAKVSGTNLVKSGTGTMTLSNTANSYSGSTNVNDGTLIGSSKTIKNAINNNGTVMFNETTDGTVSNALNGWGNYVKRGTGTTTFSASSNGTGDLYVEEGIAKITGSMPSMDVFAAGGTVTGTGQISTLIIDDIGTYSPGASPGTQTVYRSIWDGGGTYLWEINNATGSVGTNWDYLNVTDQTAITAVPWNKLTLDITSLTLANDAGPCANFSSTSNYNWKISTAANGIIGFSQDVFNLVISDFKNPGVSLDKFFLYKSGNDIMLAYQGDGTTPSGYTYVPYTPIGEGWWTAYVGTPISPEPTGDVPEPSTLLLLLPFLGFGLRRLRKRRVS